MKPMLSLVLAAVLCGTVVNSQAATDPAQIAAKSGCLACHMVDKKLVGPSYRDIAQKYKGNAGAQAALVARLRTGGKGVDCVYDAVGGAFWHAHVQAFSEHLDVVDVRDRGHDLFDERLRRAQDFDDVVREGGPHPRRLVDREDVAVAHQRNPGAALGFIQIRCGTKNRYFFF